MRKTCLSLLGAAALILLPASAGADHFDAPSTIANPAAAINDLYAFVDGSRVVVAMTVWPQADGTARFSDKVQYVFHVGSSPQFNQSAASTDIVCTFDQQQIASCWAGTDDYVSGDASETAGLSSASQKLRVFAGLRADPFAFNMNGFKDVVETLHGAMPMLTFDATGCPMIDPATSSVLVTMLKSTAKGSGPAQDFFAASNTLAIVVSVDKSLVNSGGPILNVWASTHQAP